MTSTSISLSRIEHDVMKDILLDYIVILTDSTLYDSMVDVKMQAKLSDARYLLERLSDATN